MEDFADEQRAERIAVRREGDDVPGLPVAPSAFVQHSDEFVVVAGLVLPHDVPQARDCEQEEEGEKRRYVPVSTHLCALSQMALR